MNPETIRNYGYTVDLNYPPANYTSTNLHELVNDIISDYPFTNINYTPSQDEDL